MFDEQKKWIKLNLQHPLKQNYWLWIKFLYLIFAILIIFHFVIFSPFLKTEFQFILGIFISVFISIFIFYYTQEEIKRREYADALEKLLEELCINKVESEDFSIKVKSRFMELKKENKWNWISKQVSYTNWANGKNFHLKYFQTNAYFAFVNRGYILDEKIFKKSKEQFGIPREEIGNLYQLFTDFNYELQRIENLINSKHDHKTPNAFYEYPTDVSGNIPYSLNIDNSHEIKHDFKGVTKKFSSDDDFEKFLIDDFYEYYRSKHINGGISKNFKVVTDRLSEYYDFEAEIKRISLK